MGQPTELFRKLEEKPQPLSRKVIVSAEDTLTDTLTILPHPKRETFEICISRKEHFLQNTGNSLLIQSTFFIARVSQHLQVLEIL